MAKGRAINKSCPELNSPTHEFLVTGMHCGSCEKAVKAALKKRGFGADELFEVNYKTGKLKVCISNLSDQTPDSQDRRLIEAVTKAGFKVEVKKK